MLGAGRGSSQSLLRPLALGNPFGKVSDRVTSGPCKALGSPHCQIPPSCTRGFTGFKDPSSCPLTFCTSLPRRSSEHHRQLPRVTSIKGQPSSFPITPGLERAGVQEPGLEGWGKEEWDWCVGNLSPHPIWALKAGDGLNGHVSQGPCAPSPPFFSKQS